MEGGQAYIFERVRADVGYLHYDTKLTPDRRQGSCRMSCNNSRKRRNQVRACVWSSSTAVSVGVAVRKSCTPRLALE